MKIQEALDILDQLLDMSDIGPGHDVAGGLKLREALERGLIEYE